MLEAEGGIPPVTCATEDRRESLSADPKRQRGSEPGFSTPHSFMYLFYLSTGFSHTYCYPFVPRCCFPRQPQWERLVCRAIFAFLPAFTGVHIVNTHINRMLFIFKEGFWSRVASQLREWKCSDLYHLSQWRLLPSYILTFAELL